LPRSEPCPVQVGRWLVCLCAPAACTASLTAHAADEVDDAATEAPGSLVPVDEIVVHGTNPDEEDTRARTTLDAEDLEASAGEDLATALSRVPGVDAAAGTSDASKPIIRGHRERRLLVLYDGVRHESQKWGPDHATEIDPFAAGRITVVRGPAGARYGPDAIGGVVLVEPPELSTATGVSGTLHTAYASNGRSPYGAARLDVVPETAPRWTLRLEGNASTSSTRVSPDYLLGNTASRTGNLGGAVGYRFFGGEVRASWHHHAFQAGVFYGVRTSTPSEFEAQIDDDRPLTADLWTRTYDIDRPYQQVAHDIGLLHIDHDGAVGRIEATYALQLNHRQEFEQVRSTVEGPQYDFLLRTHSLDVMASHPRASTALGVLTGGLGLQGSFQENVYRGYALLPNYRAFGGGLFVYERLSRRRIDLEVGARVDGLARAAYMGEDDFGRHLRRGTLDEERCEKRDDGARCPAAYESGSLSLGTVMHAVPDTVDLKIDLSSANRFPNVDELYLIGNAPSFPVYALGWPDLGVESARGVSATALLHTHAVEAEVSVYGQLVDDYILFAPDLNAAGEPRFDVTIRGTWPRYAFRPIDAELNGVDGALHLAPYGDVGLDLWGGMVRARDRSDDRQLVGTPADRLDIELVGRPRPRGLLGRSEVRATARLVDRQRRVDPADDFTPPPDGYALFGMALDAELGRERVVRLGLSIRNVLNTPFREATSLLRYYADHPGRDVRLRMGVDI